MTGPSPEPRIPDEGATCDHWFIPLSAKEPQNKVCANCNEVFEEDQVLRDYNEGPGAPLTRDLAEKAWDSIKEQCTAGNVDHDWWSDPLASKDVCVMCGDERE